ncbi:O-antigen ligase family protein [Cryobacterium frigoriphilum]|uniref:O-antigen ligase family protein n=1 Tax=Cryobacterium frigoriphilum TaxID=1259150 RepID=UPI00141AB791|nr:O-antigen ligase family protein [Cryobacterium frigoriphilum]
MILLWAQSIVPLTLQAWFFDKRQSLANDVYSMAPIPALLTSGLGALVLVVAVATIFLGVQARSQQRPPPAVLVVAVSPWLYIVSRDLYAGHTPSSASYAYPLVLTALWLVSSSVDRILSLLGLLVFSTAALSILMAVFVPASGIYRSASGIFAEAEKEILPWGLLVGMFGSPNNLGQYLALGFAALFFIRNRFFKVLAVSATSFAVLWTSSRSSVLAVGCCLVLAFILSRAGKRPLIRRSIPFVLLGLLIYVAALPFVTTDPSSYTNRGHIWAESLRSAQAEPVFGLGSSWYQDIAGYYNQLGSLAFHGHNQVVQTIVTGGSVFAALVLALILLLIVRASKEGRHGHFYPALFLSALLISCALEVSLGFVDRTFLFSVFLVPIALILFGRRELPVRVSTSLNMSAHSPASGQRDLRRPHAPRFSTVQCDAM